MMLIVASDAVGATLAQIQVSTPDSDFSCLSTSKLHPAVLSSHATKKLDDIVEAY